MRLISVTLGLLILSTVVNAHHSTAEYGRIVVHELQGERVNARWSNPHVTFTVRVSDANGEVGDWELSTGAVCALQINNRPLNTIDGLVFVLGEYESGDSRVFQIERRGRLSFVEVLLHEFYLQISHPPRDPLPDNRVSCP